MDKPLNKPMKSSNPKKKMMVYVMKDGKKKLIHFGQANAPDFISGASKEQRKSYLARSGGIRNKKGELTKNIKSSPNYWSRRILWKA